MEEKNNEKEPFTVTEVLDAVEKTENVVMQPCPEIYY